MATYAIGDIHGCRETLDRLLEAVDFNRGRDRVWLVGDLVNGGPDSLGVVRWARQLGDRAVVVLGNHDLHMLAVAAGAQSLQPDDTFGDLLEAPDSDTLLDWLLERPLVHRREDWLMVHAGLMPAWSAEEAEELAGEVEAVLRGPEYGAFFEEMYGDTPRRWSPDLRGTARLRLIVNATTRMRTVTPDAALELSYKRTLEAMPEGLVPWFRHPERASRDTRILFGHWSALGYHEEDNVVGLDSGARWGEMLSALRLEDGEVFQVPSQRPAHFE